jgi:hypothetical protein
MVSPQADEVGDFGDFDASGEFVGTTPAPPSGDRVELTDLEVIQRWSLAVRGATAERAEIVAALRADLAWLEGRRGDTGAPARAPRASRSATAAEPAKPVGKRTAAKKVTSRSTTTRGGLRRK